MQTNKEVLWWIKKELGATIEKAIADSKVKLYPAEVLAGIACRETASIIAKNHKGQTMLAVSSLTRGDFTKRPNDKEVIPHGFSFWQIDIDSYPDFVKSGSWKDPYKACMKAIEVLEEKRKYISSKCPDVKGADLLRATIAAYNCGQGNIVKVIVAKQDIDSRTAHKDYSKCVLENAALYKTF